MSDEDPDATPRPFTQPRATRRLPIAGTLVAIDAPTVSDQPFVVDALDINAGGMGVVLPDSLQVGAEVELSFQLGAEAAFSRVPALVLHREGRSGGLAFRPWPAADRLRLLELLVRFYESRP